MRRAPIVVTAMLILQLLGSTPAGAQEQTSKFAPVPEGSEQVPGEWIVALQPFADPAESEALARSAGGQAGHAFEVALEGFVFEGPVEAARRLSEHPRVRTVSPPVPSRWRT